MNMYIGENIKRLRREKNITQEKLAEHLCISCQAISKWERAESFPDITLVIPIASYFGVSTDELLGVDDVRNEQKICEYLNEYNRLSNLGKDKKKCDLIRKAHMEFPNDFRIMDKYMAMLLYDPYIDTHTGFPGIPTHINELMTLCDRVLDSCKNENTRLWALSIQSDIYEYQGNKEKAHEIIENLPSGTSFTKEQAKENAYKTEGGKKYLYWLRKNIGLHTDEIIFKFQQCAYDRSHSQEERLQYLIKTVDFIKFLYEDGDYGFVHHYLAGLYIRIHYRYLGIDEHEKAYEALDLGLSHAKQYDELPEITTHTSFFVRGNICDRREVNSSFESNSVYWELNNIDTDTGFDKYRELEGYKAILDKYRPFAKVSKK